jgi:anti-sigma factor RsiW
VKPGINIHNYGEFFLLYVDGELSAEDRAAVEHFVQENSHLAAELQMLEQSVLQPEEVLFTDKELLYRNGDDGIHADNCESRFLLYVDNELDARAREEVETFVLQHPALQEPFLQLKQTKLEPETIVFPGKASLYRKEEKERRILYIGWQRAAVAAAFIGLIVLAGRMFSGNGEETRKEVVVASTGQPKPQAVQQPPATTAQQPATAVKEQAPLTASLVQDRQDEGVSQPAASQASEPANAVALAETPGRLQEQTTGMVHNDIPPVNTIASGAQDVLKQEKTVQSVQPATQLAVNLPETLQDTETIQAKNTQPNDAMAMTAQPAVYRELDIDEGDDRKSLYVGSLEINKDKLRGLFRKATSLFRGKAKEDEKTDNAPSHSRLLP